jgi:hypothetical protein
MLMDRLHPVIVQKLRAQALDGQSPARLFKMLRGGLGEATNIFTLVHYLRRAFGLSLAEATPFVGFNRAGTGYVEDDPGVPDHVPQVQDEAALDELVQPVLARWASSAQGGKPMTEREWFNATEPMAMLLFLRRSGKASDRKLRLYAVACCRRIWHLLADEQLREAVDAAERVAEGMADEEEREAFYRLAQERAGVLAQENPKGRFGLDSTYTQAAGWARRSRSWTREEAAVTAWNTLHPVPQDDISLGWADARAAIAVGWAAVNAWVTTLPEQTEVAAEEEAAVRGKGEEAERACQCRILNDVFGLLAFSPLPHVAPEWLAWHDGLIPKLAQAIYEERAMPEGTLDAQRLAVLADALEDAGCVDVVLLDHLRGPGPHVRGCFVVDLLTGRE